MTSFQKICLPLLLIAASAGTVPPGKGSPNRLPAFPRVTLWAWESRQDLRTIDPEKFAVAYLDRSVFIGDEVITVPRMQPLHLPTSVRLMAVVRIETRFTVPSRRAALDLPRFVAEVAGQLAEAAQKPGVSALQIDFDATQSQRAFYRRLIEETRRRMPAGMPLSITALASWCGPASWLAGLPVDEAVPMLFRMGPDRRTVRLPGWNYSPAAPLCATSVGVSIDEAWPRIEPGRRIYVFHPRAWNPVALKNLEQLVNP